MSNIEYVLFKKDGKKVDVVDWVQGKEVWSCMDSSKEKYRAVIVCQWRGACFNWWGQLDVIPTYIPTTTMAAATIAAATTCFCYCFSFNITMYMLFWPPCICQGENKEVTYLTVAATTVAAITVAAATVAAATVAICGRAPMTSINLPLRLSGSDVSERKIKECYETSIKKGTSISHINNILIPLLYRTLQCLVLPIL